MCTTLLFISLVHTSFFQRFYSWPLIILFFLQGDTSHHFQSNCLEWWYTWTVSHAQNLLLFKSTVEPSLATSFKQVLLVKELPIQNHRQLYTFLKNNKICPYCSKRSQLNTFLTLAKSFYINKSDEEGRVCFRRFSRHSCSICTKLKKVNRQI